MKIYLKKLKSFADDPIKTMLKSPLLLRGHEKILRNLLTWVHKSIPNFPVLLEGYKKMQEILNLTPTLWAFNVRYY